MKKLLDKRPPELIAKVKAHNYEQFRHRLHVQYRALDKKRAAA